LLIGPWRLGQGILLPAHAQWVAFIGQAISTGVPDDLECGSTAGPALPGPMFTKREVTGRSDQMSGVSRAAASGPEEAEPSEGLLRGDLSDTEVVARGAIR
jgi:hypothetical protein